MGTAVDRGNNSMSRQTKSMIIIEAKDADIAPQDILVQPLGCKGHMYAHDTFLRMLPAPRCCLLGNLSR